MPMDNIISYGSDMAFADHCLGWTLKFSLIPRTCHYSKKRIWLECAYKGTAMWTGPGEPAFEYRWCKRSEFLFLKLKGKI